MYKRQILTDNPLNDSLIEEIKSIPGVTDGMTREIVSVNLNGTRFPAAIVSKKMCIRDRWRGHSFYETTSFR